MLDWQLVHNITQFTTTATMICSTIMVGIPQLKRENNFESRHFGFIQQIPERKVVLLRYRLCLAQEHWSLLFLVRPNPNILICHWWFHPSSSSSEKIVWDCVPCRVSNVKVSISQYSPSVLVRLHVASEPVFSVLRLQRLFKENRPLPMESTRSKWKSLW